jgi:hypothetical protein
MRSTLRLRLAVAAALLLPLAARAEEPAAPPMFVVHVEYALPSQLQQYESTTKEFVGLVQQHRDKVPGFWFNALQGEDLSYAFVSPVGGFQQIGAMYGGLTALGEAVGTERWADFMQRTGATYDHVDEWIFIELTDASYVPAAPRLRQEEEQYVQLDFYRVRPGMEMAAEAVARDWRALHAKLGLADGFRIYRAVMGSDMPLYVVSFAAKNPADLEAMLASGRAAMGADGQALNARTMAVTRAFESKRFWWRRDLSLLPPMPATASR